MEIPYKLEVLWCRAFQGVLKIGNYFMGYRMPKYLEGPGKIKELGTFLKEKRINDLLIVTDRGLMEIGLPGAMLEALDRSGIRYTCFSDLGPNPTSDDVEKGFRLYRENGCKAVVAFGGGSPIDCAKAICAKAAHPRRTVVQMQGILRVLKPIVPLIAVPTTAGTGSETTVAAVIHGFRHPPKGRHQRSVPDPQICHPGSGADGWASAPYHRHHRHGCPGSCRGSLHQQNLQYKTGKQIGKGSRQADP